MSMRKKTIVMFIDKRCDVIQDLFLLILLLTFENWSIDKFVSSAELRNNRRGTKNVLAEIALKEERKNHSETAWQ